MTMSTNKSNPQIMGTVISSALEGSPKLIDIDEEERKTLGRHMLNSTVS